MHTTYCISLTMKDLVSDLEKQLMFGSWLVLKLET